MASPLPSTVMRPLTRRVCAKALALTSTSNNSENTDKRILFMPVLLLGWVRLAATGAASPAELKGLCLAFSWPLFMGRDMRCQVQRMLDDASAAGNLLLSGTKKNAGQEPAFLIDSFTVYGLSLTVLRTLFSRLRLLRSRWGRRRWCPRGPEVNTGRRLARRRSLVVRSRFRTDHFGGARQRACPG